MTSNTRVIPRALTTAAVATTFYLMSCAGMAAAQAHVHVNADDPARGGTTIVTFQVPNESEKGSLTTKLTVALPNVASARADVLPGWTVTLDKDPAAGTVRGVARTALEFAVNTTPGRSGLFSLGAALLVCALAATVAPRESLGVAIAGIAASGIAARAVIGHLADSTVEAVAVAGHVLAAALWCGTLAGLAATVTARGQWARVLPRF